MNTDSLSQFAAHCATGRDELSIGKAALQALSYSIVAEDAKTQSPSKPVTHKITHEQIKARPITDKKPTDSLRIEVVRCDTLDAVAALLHYLNNTAIAATDKPKTDAVEKKQIAGPQRVAVDVDEKAATAVPAAAPKKLAARVLVMNMASEYKPGGGWLNGAVAQEECLFYQTDAFRFLEGPRAAIPDHKRPYLQPNEMLLSEGVRRSRASFQKKYRALPEARQFTFDMVTVAAPRRPALVNNGSQYARRSDDDLMRAKIDTVFWLAVDRGYDALFLGALGCGVFQNPGPRVVQIYNECIGRYGGHFRAILFAVWDKLPLPKKSNYALFKQHITVPPRK